MNVSRNRLTRVAEFFDGKPVKRIFSILGVTLIFDAIASVLWASIFESPVTLSSSIFLNLSNLMFIEGAVVFALGSFALFYRSQREIRRSLKESKEISEGKLVTSTSIRTDALMLVIGAILLGLSAAVFYGMQIIIQQA